MLYLGVTVRILRGGCHETWSWGNWLFNCRKVPNGEFGGCLKFSSNKDCRGAAQAAPKAQDYFPLPCNYLGYLKIPATWTWIVFHSSPTEKLQTKDFRSTGEKHTIESSETIILHLKQITDILSAKQVFTLLKSTNWSPCHSKLLEAGSLSIQDNYPHDCPSACLHMWIRMHIWNSSIHFSAYVCVVKSKSYSKQTY